MRIDLKHGNVRHVIYGHEDWHWNSNETRMTMKHTRILIIKWLIDFIFIYIWHDEGIYRKEQIESEFPDINVYNK